MTVKTYKHNPHCKLVETTINNDYEGKKVMLVYGIENDNKTNEGLEAYYFKNDSKSIGHYKSYRWDHDSIPKKYQAKYKELKSLVSNVPDGHKLIVNMMERV